MYISSEGEHEFADIRFLVIAVNRTIVTDLAVCQCTVLKPGDLHVCAKHPSWSVSLLNLIISQWPECKPVAWKEKVGGQQDVQPNNN